MVRQEPVNAMMCGQTGRKPAVAIDPERVIQFPVKPGLEIGGGHQL